jgi:small conductance mechanosensitive channel
MFPDGFSRLTSTLSVIVFELLAAALISAIFYAITLSALSTLIMPRGHENWRSAAKAKFRSLWVAVFAACAIVVLAVNGLFVMQGFDPQAHTLSLIRGIERTTWIALVSGLGKLVLAFAVVFAATRLIQRLLRKAGKTCPPSFSSLFASLDRVVVNLGWILLVVFATVVFPFPSAATEIFLVIARVYLVCAVGFIAIRSGVLIVETIDGLVHRYAQRRQRLPQYDRLHPLVPTFRACLEYALWVAVASLVMVQVSATEGLAAWGPRVIQAIAIFFAGRVFIELGHLEIEHRMLPDEGLEETDRRRRKTMLPLVQSTFGYAVYFGTAVLMLGVLGFNPMPFLAGAGLLGLVVGFGAQSLINDVVSGFFILFENLYLVGDIIEVGGARGVVEAIEFRTTKIRDGDGRVHIIRNGDMKPITNYSKDYSVAVVSMEVSYDTDLKAVFASLRQAGDRLRAENRDLLGNLKIDGITAFGLATMTVRTSARTRPGRHDAVASALRLLINETFDRRGSDAPRRSLVGR